MTCQWQNTAWHQKYVQPMDLLSDVAEKSTVKAGFYIPRVHIFLNSVHIFIGPA
jgi:hypothetical protein